MKLQIAANKAGTKYYKEQKKQMTKFQKDMRSVGKSFADALLSGDIKGAFQGLFKRHCERVY